MGDDEEEGQTLDSKLNSIKHGNFSSLSKYRVLILDEMSMAKELHLNALYNWLKSDASLGAIFVGNWVQLKPVGDRSEDFDYENAHVFHEMCGGNLMQLTKCRRGDSALFNTYKDIKQTKNIDRRKFGSKEVDRAICFYNSTVHRLNKYWMQKYMPSDPNKWFLAKTNKQSRQLRKTQDIIVFKGLPVMACVTRAAYGLKNSTTWRVKMWNREGVILESDESHKCKKVSPPIPADDFANMLRPSYAITSHKSQGQTIRRPFVIHDWEDMQWRGRYVSVSRGTKLSDVNISNDDCRRQSGRASTTPSKRASKRS